MPASIALHAALAQAPVDVLAEAVVAVPGVAEADDARARSPERELAAGAPRVVATWTVQTRQASCERTMWKSSTGLSRSLISRPTKLSSQCPRRPASSRGEPFQAVGVMTW